jgi:hypothetical protein
MSDKEKKYDAESMLKLIEYIAERDWLILSGGFKVGIPMIAQKIADLSGEELNVIELKMKDMDY